MRTPTWRQNEAVSTFYSTVRRLLSAALRDHLEKHFQSFSKGLLAQANSVHPQIKTELLSTLDERLKAIESTLSLATSDQKTRVTNYLAGMLATLPNIASDRVEVISIPQLPSSEKDLKPVSYEILDGAKGYSYERVFGAYMAGAASIVVEDPYIRKRYQLDNFSRFCGLAVSLGAVKEITLKTGTAFGEDLDDSDARLESIKRDLANHHGVKLSWTRSEKLHDREVIFSTGWVVKIGRGLDIYYPPENWASVGASNYNLRKCRQTKVDILWQDAERRLSRGLPGTFSVSTEFRKFTTTNSPPPESSGSR